MRQYSSDKSITILNEYKSIPNPFLDPFWPLFDPFWPLFTPFLDHFWTLFCIHLSMAGWWSDQNRGSISGPPVFDLFWPILAILTPFLDHFWTPIRFPLERLNSTISTKIGAHFWTPIWLPYLTYFDLFWPLFWTSFDFRLNDQIAWFRPKRGSISGPPFWPILTYFDPIWPLFWPLIRFPLKRPNCMISTKIGVHFWTPI